MHIAFLHTADVHVQTFGRIVGDLEPDAEVSHRVEAGLLAKARSNGLDSVRDETLAALTALSKADAVVCTCSTLGPIADEFSATHPHVIRIDRPMMNEAVTLGGKILVVVCLDSTLTPTLDLLADCAKRAGTDVEAVTVVCHEAWPYFEAGDDSRFSDEIGRKVRAALADSDEVSCIILAQASMRVAAEALSDLPIPVLCSPEMAARKALSILQFS